MRPYRSLLLPHCCQSPRTQLPGAFCRLCKSALLQGFLSVGAVGLEPTLLLRTRILSPVRLPIPPRPRELDREYNSLTFLSSQSSSALSGRDGRGAGESIRLR